MPSPRQAAVPATTPAGSPWSVRPRLRPATLATQQSQMVELLQYSSLTRNAPR